MGTLEIKGLKKNYGHKEILKGLDFSIYPYEIYAVLGRNGCGKTTLFKCLMGLIEPNAGKIVYEGNEVNFDVRKHFGYMPEQRSLLPDLTMREHLSLMGVLKKMDESLIDERILKLSEDFELQDFLDKRIHSLSKGQQQKTQLMVALMNEPELLILDEPLSGLDIDSVDFFLNALKDYASKGHSILISSHQMEFMDALCSHILLLNQGEIVQKGSLSEIQAISGISLRINASAHYEPLLPLCDRIESQGAYVHFYVKDKVKAKRLLTKAHQCEGLTQLRLSPLSVSELLKEHL